jgi:hypothetical protein
MRWLVKEVEVHLKSDSVFFFVFGLALTLLFRFAFLDFSYGGYGKLDRGVRMYELLLTNNDGNENNDVYNDKEEESFSEGTKLFQWRTWVS